MLKEVKAVVLRKPSQKLIEHLESILEKVRSGEVDGVALAYTRLGGGVGWKVHSNEGCNTLELLAAVDMLHHNTTALAVEDAEDS